MDANDINVPTHVSHGEKLEKFNENDFKRWQQKMLLYLTTLNLVKFLREDAPVCSERGRLPSYCCGGCMEAL